MANAKEAQARIKINKLLETVGWRFFDDTNGKANVALEPNIKLSQNQIDDLGENFESTKNGFVDFLLLDEKSFPLVVLEAKSEDKKSACRQRAGASTPSHSTADLSFIQRQLALLLGSTARESTRHHDIPFS